MSKIIYTDNKDEKSVFEYIPNFLDSNELKELKVWLEIQNYLPGTSKSGNEISRKQIWFQENQKYFCNKWAHRYDRWQAQKYPKFLYSIQNYIQTKLKMTGLNSCLINLYENGTNIIAAHRDSPDSFGVYPTIINLSVGATRVLRISNKDEVIDFPLENNSLFIMAGASQKYYVHEIVEDISVKDPRYSLTFREML